MTQKAMLQRVNDDSPVVWVTGSGAARVGKSIAELFAISGYRIVLHANRSSELAEETARKWNEVGMPTHVVKGDIRDDSFAENAVGEIVERFGRLDVLVHSAAIWGWKELEKVTAKDVVEQFEVNALGAFLCAKSAGLQMVKQQSGGSIVMIGDWAVSRPYVDFAPYFLSKGGIETMTRSLAIELASRNANIRVNAILPGTVLLDDAITEDQAERIRRSTLLKRNGCPEDVAAAAKFLAEQEFITGVCLPVDGGRSIYSGPSGENGIDAIAHPTFQSKREKTVPTTEV